MISMMIHLDRESMMSYKMVLARMRSNLSKALHHFAEERRFSILSNPGYKIF